MPYFKKALVKEYGEQTYRDAKSQNGKCTKSLKKLELASWGNAMVAGGCGLIDGKYEAAFRRAIVRYAKTTRFSKRFF